MKKEDITNEEIQHCSDNRKLRQRKLKKQKLAMIVRRITDQIQRVHQDSEPISKANPHHYPKGSGKGGQFAPGHKNAAVSSSGPTAMDKVVRSVSKSKTGLSGSDEAHTLIHALANKGMVDHKEIANELKKAGHKSASGRTISTATIKAVLKRTEKQIASADKQPKVMPPVATSHSKDKIEKLVGLFRSMGHDDKAIQGKLKEKNVKTEAGRNVSISTIRTVIKRVDKQLAEQKPKVITTSETKQETTPVEKKTQVAELPAGMTIGNRSVVYDYPKPFKTLSDAKVWVEKNLADKMTFEDENIATGNNEFLHNLNRSLSHVRLLSDSGVPLPRVRRLNIHHGDIIDLATVGGKPGEKAYGVMDTSANNTLHLAIPHLTKENDLGNAVRQVEMNQNGLSSRKRQLIEALQHKQSGALPKTVDHMRPEKELLSKIKEVTTQQQELDGAKRGLLVLGTIDRGAIQRYPNREKVSEGSRANLTFDSRLAGTLMHELGHAFHSEKSDLAEQDLDKNYNYTALRKNWNAGGKERYTQVNKQFVTSPYSAVNIAENFAEAFALYMNAQVQGLHPKYVEFFDKQFPQLSFGKNLMNKTQLVKSEILEIIKKGSK